MARRKYPEIRVMGHRLNGGIPPELMCEEERVVWATARSIESSSAIGGRPRTDSEAQRIREAERLAAL